MFKGIGDGIQPLVKWVNAWLKGEVNVRLPILFECGCSYSKMTVNRALANDLYRELILKGKWEIVNCYADFLKDEKAINAVERVLMAKNLTIFGYRRQTYNPSEDWGMFTERNLNKKAYEEHAYMFTHSRVEQYVGENPKKEGKARSLYFKGKLAKKDKNKEKLLLKSVMLGYVPAFSELAFVYEGMGNTAECLRWHEEGAKHGLQESAVYLANVNEGREKEYDYLKRVYDCYGTYPSNLMRLARIIERDLFVKGTPSRELREEKERVLFDCLARVILEWAEIESDKTEEVNEARLMLARLILEKKINLDGTFAIVLLEVVKHHKIKVDESLNKLALAYCDDEIQRIRKRITRKMEDALSTFSREANERVESDKPFREKRQEQARLEREEKERKEQERKERELKEFLVEAQKDAERIREEKRLSWDRPLDLGKSAEYAKLKGESDQAHKNAVTLYQKALDSFGEEDTLNALVLAGEAGHPRAIWELSKYYHDYDEEWAEYWLLKCASQGNLNHAFTSKWKWNIGYVLRYAKSKNKDIYRGAIEALGKLSIKTLTPTEETGLKALADKGEIIAIKAYTKYIKYKNTSEWVDYTYKGANMGDEECINAIVQWNGDINTNCSNKHVVLLKNDKVQANHYVQYEWFKIYSSTTLSAKFGVTADAKKAFSILQSLKAKKPTGELKKAVSLDLARCFELGIGTEVQIYFASTHYRGYDDKKADALLKQFEERQEREICERKAVQLMAKYPCVALSNLQRTNPTWANAIIAKYKTTAPEKLEENLKARDEYLGIGLTLPDMYELDGTFKEHQARGAYLRIKREREEKAKREAEERARIKRIEEENARLVLEQTRLKEEQARLKAEQEKARESQKNTATAGSGNTTKSVSKATKKQQKEQALAPVRKKYGYDPNGGYTEHLQYFFRMCEGREKGKFKELVDENLEAVGELLGVSPDSIVTARDFAFILSQKIEKIVGCCPSVDFRCIEHTAKFYAYAEHDLAGLPVYGGSIIFDVGFLQDIRYNNISSAPTSMDIFYDEYQRFHAHEISKFVDYNEYARESGLNYELYSLEREEVNNGKSAARKITRAIAKEMLKHYTIIESTLIGTREWFKKYYRLIPLIPTGIKVDFEFWGND